MPRPPAYSARSRAVLSRSFAIIPSPRGARTIRFSRTSVFRPAWFSVPDVPSHRKPIPFKYLRTLFLSCRSFLHSFPLFSMVCGLFCKIPGGVGGTQTVLGHRGGLLRSLFTGEARLAMVQNGRADKSTLPPEKIMPSFEGAQIGRA